MNLHDMQSNDGELPDYHRNMPKPSPDCLYGLIGDIAKLGGRDTEVSPFAIALNVMSYLSVAIGRGPYLQVGNTKHHTRLFTLHIGRSGRGRKGDAMGLLKCIHAELKKMDEHLAPNLFSGGLSSREGLIDMIRDSYTEGSTENKGVEDKRLCVVEAEFANVLQQSKRQGNTLSAALRTSWDGDSIAPATKNSKIAVTDPHIGLIGAITPSELRILIETKDLINGFANRFLFSYLERDRLVPHPPANSQTEIQAMAKHVQAVLKHCAAHRWVDKNIMRIEFTAAAHTAYSQLYKEELNDCSSGEKITSLIERRAPMVLRMAMLFALCDLETKIDVHHLNAAMAWIRFSIESVKYIFSSESEQADADEISATAKTIVAYLRIHLKATRTQITSECFKGHLSKAMIDPAIAELLTSNPPQIKLTVIPRTKESPGTPTKIYELVNANSANSANNV
jgi:Protein of unknown function (DUF3987)